MIIAFLEESYNIFSKSYDLDVMTSSDYAWLDSFVSTYLDVPNCQT